MHMADTKALFSQRFDAARSAMAKGDSPAAAESLHWAIVAARSDPGLRRELASALFNLGTLSRKLGRAGEAEAGPLLTEALAISEELFGREHAALVPVLNELSRLHLQQSQHARAEEALDRLLAIARLKGDEHPDVAAALSGLAFVKRKLGDEASAEALYRDALRIREKVLEPNDMVIVGTLEKLSETCAARGNFAEALALLQRALPAREAVLGANHERVRAARSRVAELELQIAIEADTAAAAAAKAAKAATPTPVWLKRVPDPSADTPANAAPSPINSTKLEFLGESEPQTLRPAPRPRERAKTPAVAAAVAAASLLASSMRTPSASQIAISPPESARPSESVVGHESGAAHRDAIFPDVVFADVGHVGVAHADVAHADAAAGDVALGDWAAAIAPAPADSPEPARRKRLALFGSAALAATALAIAGLLMARPHAGGGKDPNASERTAAQSTVTTTTTTTTAPVATPRAPSGVATASAATAAAAMAAAGHTDSLRSASATPARAAAAVQSEQRVAPSAAPELPVPRVDVHVGTIDIRSAPATLSVDSIMRSLEREHASDTERIGLRNEVSAPRSPDVDNAHTSPKIIGRIPDPGFPDALLRSGPHDGQVVVRFMVNEFGRADVATMVVERSDHELFTQAVRDILPLFRFEPARTKPPESKPVAAWVSVPFRFTTKKK
jgi:TonB family protein